MKSLRQLLHYVSPYRWAAILSVVTAFLMVASELVVPRLLEYLIDEGIRPGDIQVLIVGVLLILLAALGGVIATLGQGYYRARLSQELPMTCATICLPISNRSHLPRSMRCKLAV
jgi:ATP-binding cassette, subfamily B, multidrug efflux pump